MTDDATTTECPPLSELERLVRGRCTEARSSALCEHVGGCPECQRGWTRSPGPGPTSPGSCAPPPTAPRPSIPRTGGPRRGEEELRRTAFFEANGLADTPVPENELRLDFLQPADTPGRLGRWPSSR
jgi:hypothetical protein